MCWGDSTPEQTCSSHVGRLPGTIPTRSEGANLSGARREPELDREVSGYMHAV